MHMKLIVPIVPILAVSLYLWTTRKERFVNSLPLTKIGKIKEGDTKIEGKIYAKENLISPYFREPCVGYLYTQEEVYKSDEGDDHYSTILTETKSDDFYIADETGEFFISASTINLQFCTPQSKKIKKIRHTEYLLRHQQLISISGKMVLENNSFRFSTADPIYVASPDNINKLWKKINVFGRMRWYFLPLYLFINYLLFFYPAPVAEPYGGITFFLIFGLPIVAVVFAWLSSYDIFTIKGLSIFKILATICLISSFLTFPLFIILFLLTTPILIIQYIFYATVGTVALFSFLHTSDVVD
jgi:hypothetical protein